MSGSTVNLKAGIASLSIDGVAYDVVSNAAYMVSTVTRETLKGQSGIQGYSEMPNAPYISATIRDNGGLTVSALNALTSSVLVLSLANGKTVYGDNMWSTEVAEVDTQAGTFAVHFEGFNVIEQTI